jgi:hypothetical protein
MSPKVIVHPPGSPAEVFGPVATERPARRSPPTKEKGKGFIRRCVEIIIQDAKDRLYAERARKRREYEDFLELYGPRRPGDGVT